LVLVLCFSYFTDNSIVPKDLQICIGSHSEKNSPIPCTLDPTRWIIRLVIWKGASWWFQSILYSKVRVLQSSKCVGDAKKMQPTNMGCVLPSTTHPNDVNIKIMLPWSKWAVCARSAHVACH
jgi:hypothetical protein